MLLKAALLLSTTYGIPIEETRQSLSSVETELIYEVAYKYGKAIPSPAKPIRNIGSKRHRQFCTAQAAAVLFR
jgi:hypothetical protein